MKKFILINLLIVVNTFLNSFPLLAQVIYKPGKIVTLSGDTLNGLIGDQKKKHNPDKILFKADDSSGSIDYLPTTIKAAIIVGSDYYKSAKVNIDMNYEKTWERGTTYSKDTLQDTVFLRVLVESKLSLYLYNDENFKDHFYYSLDGKNYSELINKNVSEYSDGIYYDKIFEKYKNQLNYLMKDCSQATAKIKYTKYNENPLSDLFSLYNKCIDENVSIFKSQPIRNINKVYALGGIDVSTLKFESETDFYLESANFSNSVNPTLGIGVNFSLDRTKNKYSVFLELTAKKFDLEANFFHGAFYEYNAHFKWMQLKLNSAFQFKFHVEKLNPYIFAGPSLSYILYDNSILYSYNHNPNILSVYSRESVSEDFYTPLKAGYSYFGGAGINYKKFGLELRYESSSYLKNQIGVKSGVKSFYGILKYYI